MKILALSDIHFETIWCEWIAAEVRQRPPDVVCLTGDFLNMFAGFGGSSSMYAQAGYMRKFLSSLQGTVFCCSGNHDLEIGDEQRDERDFLKRAAEENPNIRGDFALEVVGDMRFYCHPWGHGVPFFWPYPESACLLSHAPPIGTRLSVGETGECGDPDVRTFVMKLPPGSIVLCGHVHAPLQWAEKVGDAWCLNPGCSDYPRPIPSMPNNIVIDTDKKTAVLRTARGTDVVRLD